MTRPGLSSPRGSDGLAAHVDAETLATVGAHYAIRVTGEILAQITGGADDPVARQYVPSTDELRVTAAELADPTGDFAHEKVKGLIHRYKDRALLKPTLACMAYCRFCFRREQVGQGEPALSEAELDAAFAYVAAHDEIYEVILSGGDPLVLSNRRLSAIMARLGEIPHVRVVRIHTRVPLVEPSRIDDALIAALHSPKQVYMVLHVNHAQELSANVRAAIARLRAAGIPLLSQSVLLRGINDKAETLETLFRELLAMGVTPYYLHHADMAKGTGHFRLSIAEGQAIMRHLRGRLSGLALPTYVVDIPGGHGKVPIGPQYLDGDEITDPNGKRHLLSGG